MSHLFQDLQFALRSFARSPGFFAVAIITLALGVGATTGVLSVVDAVLLRSLPYPGSERLVSVGTVFAHDPDGFGPLSPGSIFDLREQSATIETIVGSSDASMTLLGVGDPELIDAAQVGRGFFDVLGVELTLGRGFAPQDFEADAANVAVLEHGFWRERWGGDIAVIGTTITLNREPYTIIGVAPADFFAPEAVYGQQAARMWLPLRLPEPQRGSFGYQAFGRLADGVTLAAANDEIDALFRGQTEAYGLDFEVGGRVVSLREQTLGTSGEPLTLLLAAVGVLLLIACANVANLMLAKGTIRGRELAVRAALGAGRWRIVRQLLTESVMLALVGGAAGAVLSYWAVEIFKASSPGGVPRLAEVAVDFRVLALALVLSTAVGLLFGLAPALQALRSDASTRLRAAATSVTTSRAGGRTRAALVVAETALALVLLIGAALLVNSFVRVDAGFESEGLMTMRVNVRSAYPERDTWQPFFLELLREVEAIPGVEGASLTTSLPFAGIGIMSSVVPLDVGEQPVEESFVPTTYVSPGHFRNMGMNLLEGRDFEGYPGDGPLYTIVNEALAREYWPTASSVLGKRIRMGGDAEDPVVTVVGVVNELRYRHDQPPMSEMYLHVEQDAWRSMTVVARAAGDSAALAGPMRQAVWRIDPDLAIDRVASADQLAWNSIGRPRFYSALAAILAALALALALIGIYGTISYAVGSRVRELGIRIALGARPGAVVAMVLRSGMRLAAVGVALGAAGAWAASRLLERFLFGITPTDVPTFLAAALLFVGTAMLACYLPARRAARLDPVRALRTDT